MSINAGIGEVYTTRIQKQNFCGLGVYDPTKVFTKPDENGKVYVDGVLSTICKADEVPKDYVVIGGKEYKTVKIGNQTWLAENLEYIDDNITLGSSSVSSTVAQANWYSNKESNSYGLLYNYLAVKYIDDNKSTICPGWHVPTAAEMQSIADLGWEATRDDTWTNYPGNNSSGFSLKAAGQFTNSFDNKGIGTGLYTITPTSETGARRMNSVNKLHQMSNVGRTTQLSLRLIKDA